MAHITEVPAAAPAVQPTPSVPRQPYSPPAITHELALETRAGSPIGNADPLHIFDPRPRV